VEYEISWRKIVTKINSNKETVASEWRTRLEELPEDALIQCFLLAFKKELKNRSEGGYSSGNRNDMPEAIKAGIVAIVKEVLGNDPDEQCYAVKTELIRKTADISFTLKNGKRLVFEVKASLEFNSLAAAAAEGMFIKKSNNGKGDLIFVLFSIAGKKYSTEKAKRVLEVIFDKCPIDEVFVLSEAAGETPNKERENKVRDQLLVSLREFRSYLSNLAI
jgi:hypothetical protein